MALQGDKKLEMIDAYRITNTVRCHLKHSNIRPKHTILKMFNGLCANKKRPYFENTFLFFKLKISKKEECTSCHIVGHTKKSEANTTKPYPQHSRRKGKDKFISK